ncbi:uncharacterized protein BX663DRAFT_441675 [Cokeromyces recurvatus]|uniref:uncharacterized protein n=1 Tax=Cokeromyces recurvatus TaxID=90255 RepID=UPI002220766A|nr:uncharacterized protein BX663DRAFT_441675 [Cokeromyces recurvatus]KAI7899266.1 hypothetical protein BX663DRAFT_441675 [Cokeromyces recurvatus]
MFHSSSLRHEQYMIRSNSNKKAILHKNRSSLESETSRTDSGYSSITSHSINTKEDTSNKSIATTTITTTAATATATATASTTTTTTISNNSSKKKKKHPSPRQPDLVYSCPRPLAFPFHNDDHFLPIAEADPRDIARLTPNYNSYYSRQAHINKNQNNTTPSSSIRTSNSSQQGFISDNESSYSRRSSLLSTIQRGTVRSIRSFFMNQQHNNDTGLDTDFKTQQPKLEIKRGTVQTLKDMFNKRKKEDSSSFTHNKVVQQQQQQQQQQQSTKKGHAISNTINQFENMERVSPLSKELPTTKRTSLASQATKFVTTKYNLLTNKQQPAQERIKVTASKSVPIFPTTGTATQDNLAIKLKSKVKKFSNRISDALFQPKKSKSTSFLKQKPRNEIENQDTGINSSQIGVSKMWNSLKRLVTGKKTSRVGILL